MLEIKKEKYNYFFDTKGIDPITMVCYLLLENGMVGRGVAVCSRQDTYNEKIGMWLAKSHAIRAIKGRRVDPFKRKKVILLLIESRCPFTKKGECNPELSWWERKFLFGWRKMDKYEVGVGFNISLASTMLSIGGNTVARFAEALQSLSNTSAARLR